MIPGAGLPCHVRGTRSALADHSEIFESPAVKFIDTRARNEPTPRTNTLVTIHHAYPELRRALSAKKSGRLLLLFFSRYFLFEIKTALIFATLFSSEYSLIVFQLYIALISTRFLENL